MSQLQQIIEKARQMPLLAPSAMRLLELVANPEHNLQDMAKIISTDPALTVKILQIVNSAAFGLCQKISTVAQALPYIGEKIVVGLAMNLASPQVFNRPLLGYESKRGEMWAHGLRTAIAAGELVAFSREPLLPGVAYTAGILHDIGKAVLSKYLTGMPAEMVEKLAKDELHDYLEAENSMIGADHCVIGAELAIHWNLPDELTAAIRHHHKPVDAPQKYRSLVYIIHLADLIAMMGGIGTGSDTLHYRLDPAYGQFISIDPIGLEKIMMTVIVEFEKTQTALFGAEKETEA